MRLFLPVPLIAMFASTTAGAGEPCSKRETGQTYPWQIQGIMAGDRYAEVYVDIDETGRPLKCYIGKTNIPKDDRFWVCKAYLDDWRTQPVIKDGKAIRSTVQRLTIMPGDRHEKANREARKRFFAEHPNERPECYPE